MSASRQRRRIVDAVAGHRRRAVALSHLLDGGQLVFGQQVAPSIVDARLLAMVFAVAVLSPVSITDGHAERVQRDRPRAMFA